MSNKLSFLRGCSVLALAVTCVAVAPAAAWGQQEAAQVGDEAPASKLPTKSEDETAEDIIVTGTSISGVKPVGNEVIVITAEEAVKTGYSTPAEVLRTLPQVRYNEYDQDGGRSVQSIQNAAGASTVSLRAISGAGDSSQTLILVDGRRQVSGGTGQTYTDANQVPLAALQRIEVVTDGASAIYGADAVGGVINYVLRKDYQGGEFRIRANNQSGGLEYGIDATLGTNWRLGDLGAGNILVSYGYTTRESYLRGKNAYFRNDLRPLGGLDNRTSGASPTLGNRPAIVVGGSAANPVYPLAGNNAYYGVPAGSNVGLTAGQLQLNDVDLIDPADYTDYNGSVRRHQATASITQELGDSIELYVQGSFSDRETRTRNLSGATTVALRQYLRDENGAVTTTLNPNYVANVPGVSQGSPGFPPFFPATPAGDLAVVMPQLGDYGPREFLGTDRSFNITVGTRLKLPSNWKGDVFYTRGRNEGCTYCIVGDSYVNLEALQYQIDIGAINPLSTEPLTAAQRSSILGNQRQVGHNGIDNMAARFNGPLFALPGGTVRAAFGAEYIKTSASNENRSYTGPLNTPTLISNREDSYFSQSSTSAFGELYVPVVDEDMGIPLIKGLLLSGAVRFDKFSGTDRWSSTPKLGFDWKVTNFFSLRGSWGRSFRAPSVSNLNPDAYVSGLPLFGLPLPGSNVVTPALDNRDQRINCETVFLAPGIPLYCATNAAVLFGSNPDLKPETSTNWSLTGELSPGGGFKVSATYYNINYKNRITFPGVLTDYLLGPAAGTGGLTPEYQLGYGSFIVPINNPASCVNTDISSADSALQPYLQGPIYAAAGGVGQLGGLSNFCAIDVILDSRFTNIARTVTDGMDINVSYNRDLGGVYLSSSATVNVIFSNKDQPQAGGAFGSRLNRTDGPVKWRGRGNIGLSYEGFNATVFGNYYGGFTHDLNVSQPNGAQAENVHIPAYTTFDLTLGYATNFEGRNSGFLKGLRGSFTVTNLANKYPTPVVRADRVTVDGYGAPLGRRFSLTLTGAF